MKGTKQKVKQSFFLLCMIVIFIFMIVACQSGQAPGTGDQGTVVTPTNTPPVAYDGAETTEEDTPCTIELLADDEDDDLLTYQIDTGPEHGQVEQVEGALWKYTPETSYTGADSFTFHVNDGSEDSNSATVAITVSEKALILFVDQDATGANDGSSWDDAFGDLQDALDAATVGYQIWVAEGSYLPTSGTDRTVSFVLKPGVSLYGGFAGNESAFDKRNWTVHESILDGDLGDDGLLTNNSYHVVKGADTAVLDGFTITAGNADATIDIVGGGMFNDAVSPTVSNCRFEDNHAEYGGGMYNYSGSPSVSSCSFIDNQAEEGGGAYFSSCECTISGCTFYRNVASGSGGGVYDVDNVLTIERCVFKDNTSTTLCGGALVSVSTDLYVTTTVSNCIFYCNVAGWCGGAIGVFSSSSIYVINSTFSGNYNGVPEPSDEPGFDLYGGEFTTVSACNCIFYGTEDSIYSTGDIEVTYSLLANMLNNFGSETNIVFENPLFADIISGDFHIIEGSPCIDTGYDYGIYVPDTDFDQNPRHDIIGIGIPGTVTDMGAYEYQE